MIVRLMGDGQYELDEAFLERLNEIDDAAAEAVAAGDEATLRVRLEELARAIREQGRRLDDSSLVGSDLLVPPADLALDEARRLFEGDGLIPDLPS